MKFTLCFSALLIMAILLILNVYPVKVQTAQVSADPISEIYPEAFMEEEDVMYKEIQAETLCDKASRIEHTQTRAHKMLVRALESRGIK